MKRLILISLLLVFSSFVSATTGTSSLNVLTEEWGPITFEENGKAQGFAVDVVEAIQEQVKNDSVIQVVPWTRGYREVQNKPNVVLFTVIRSKEREKLFTLLGPIGRCEISFYGLAKSNFKIKNLEDARKVLAIGANQDTIFATILKNAGFDNLVLTKNPQQEARLLAAGRVDLISNDPLVVEAAFKKIGRNDLKLKKYLTIEKGEFYIAFSKGTPHIVMEQWKKGLEEIKTNGTFDKLVHKWLPENAIVSGNVQLIGLEAKAL